MSAPRRRRTALTDRWTLLKVVGAFLLISYLWILFSDEILGRLVRDPDVLSHIGMLKGLFYVTTTGAFLYVFFGNLIRQYRASETSLVASEERFRTVADFTRDWEYWMGPDGKFIYVSPSVERITGYKAEEFASDAGLLHRIVYDDDRCLLPEASLVTSPREVHTAEFRIITRDGRQLWIGHICQPVYGIGGEYLGRRASNRDITEAKLANEDLRSSRALLKSIVDGTSDCIYLKDLQGRYLLVNAAYTALSGRQVADLLGHDDTSVLSPSDAAALMAADRKVMQSGRISTFEETISTLVGTQTFLSTKGPVFDKQGHVAGLFGIARDITERRHMEESLRINERQLSDAVEIAGLGYWECDIATAMFALNDRVYSILGTSAGREGGYTMPVEVYAREFAPPEDSVVILQEFDIARSGEIGTSRQFDHRLIRRDGQLRYITIRYSVLRDIAGRSIKAYGVIQDITDRKLMEDSLRQSESQFRTIFETAAIGMAQADPATGRFLRVNRKLCELTGYSPEEMSTLTFSDITHPDDRQLDWQEFQQVVRGDKPEYHIEKRYVRRDGTHRWIRASVAVMRDAHGSPLRSIAAIEDIDERKHAEAIAAARARILEYSFSNTMAELLRKVLDECEDLTGSSIGFFHFLLADQETLSLQEWSTRTQDVFCTAEGKGSHYPVAQAGIWADSVRQRRPVIVNDYLAMADRHGTPPGHAVVQRYVSIPVFRGETIVAIIGVGNKLSDYSEHDVEIVRQLADLSWDIAERKQAQEQVISYRDHLEELVTDRTRQLQLALSSGRFEVWVWTAQDDAFSISPGMADVLGLDVSQRSISRDMYRSMVHPDDIPALTALRESAYNGHRESFQSEYRVRHRVKGWIWVLVSVAVELRDNDGKALRMIGLLKDISQQKELEAQLRRYSEQLEETVSQRTEDLRHERDLVNRITATSPTGIAAIDEAGRIVFANAAAEQILGLKKNIAIERAYNDPGWRITDHSGNPFPEDRMPYVLAKTTGKPVYNIGFAIERPNGQRVLLSVSAAPLFKSTGEFDGVVTAFEDVTVQSSAQLERELTIELLRIADLGMDTAQLIRHAVTFFQERSGCQAVGIRLKKGDDYPYYEARGFPKEFVLKESSLCLRDGNGHVVTDGKGDPVLECMCGNIICGRFDPSKPFFTAHGSFWTNCTTELLAGTNEADRQTRTRNRCNGEGYESVALIPLHVSGQRLGLLQLNDHRRGRFTPETIALWERLADYLAVALAKFDAEEALRESEFFFKESQRAAAVGSYKTDFTRREWESSEVLDAIFGIDRNYRRTIEGWLDIVHPDDREMMRTYLAEEVIGRRRPFDREYRIIRICDGKTRWVSGLGQVGTDGDGNVTSLIGTIQDITERKLAEEATRQSEEKYRSLFNGMTEGFALHEIICDEQGRPCDYRFLDANPAFERLTGLNRHDIVGRTVRDILPKEDPHWIELYGSVALTGQPAHFESYSQSMERHYEVYAYSPAPRQFAVLFVDITTRRLAEEAVSEHQRRLQSLASQVALAEERARRKIAVQLHDSIGHNLTLAKMRVEEMTPQLASANARRAFDGLVALLEETINASSSLTFELSSPILYELGLEAALQWLSEHTEKRHRLRVTYADDGAEHRPSEDRSVMLFQAVRELLFNIVKHARATHAAIVVYHNPDEISIHVSDDGQGFIPEATGPGKNDNGGFGLFSIRERLTSMGGRLIVRSSLGHGTHVQVTIPYR
jgi:PAS domain S-box-containing protein